MNIKITIVKFDREDILTLKEFVTAGWNLNQIYGNDSPELAAAIGRLFDNHCRR